LTRKDVSDFFEKLRQRFDWVLVDSPPLASVTDGLLIARHADMVVMVVRHNAVDKKVVKRSLAALYRVNENVLGAVLNCVDMKSQSHYYYYYHQDHPGDRGEAQTAERPVAVTKS
jgi:succinoglycan biosynthesis transport protein ExoP